MAVQSIAGLKADISEMRRGACPTLGRPMRTGDGLLARLRPNDCRLTIGQLRALAHAAADHGNGILEVTARGSLQIRGVRSETVRPLEEAVFAAAITPASGVMVEVPPLAGLDPGERIDPRPVAEDIRRAIDGHVPPLTLAPKLAITVDGGGRFHLGAVTADVRLTAIDGARFLLAVGGTNASARKVAIVDRQDAVSAVLVVVDAIAAIGPAARGKDVTLDMLDAIGNSSAVDISVSSDGPSFLGIQTLGGSGPPAEEISIVGVALPYRQAQSTDLLAFLDEIEILGLSDIRLSPGHGLILTGLHRGEAMRAEEAALRHGFWTSPAEPRASLSLCAGTSGCASAHFDTRAAAEEVARNMPGLLDGSLTLHLSGCPKGCAHPGAAALTLTGAPSGYGLVVNGAASDEPALYIAAKDLGIALGRLASLVAGAKEAGETVGDCIRRLGASQIAAALGTGLTLDGQ
jgi:precorrin-3B synthase